MQLDLQTQGIETTPALRAYVRRSLRFALGRFASRVESVRVRISGRHGRGGREDAQCHIAIKLPRLQVVVRHRASDSFGAVYFAFKRAALALNRRLKRRRTLARRGAAVPVTAASTSAA